MSQDFFMDPVVKVLVKIRTVKMKILMPKII